MVSEIKVKSKTQRAAALDNVARFLERTEHGWSPDRGRFGTTKYTKHTKMRTMTLAIIDQRRNRPSRRTDVLNVCLCSGNGEFINSFENLQKF